jgi:hypothetical protein
MFIAARERAAWKEWWKGLMAHCSSCYSNHIPVAAPRVRVPKSILGRQLYTARVKRKKTWSLFCHGLRPRLLGLANLYHNVTYNDAGFNHELMT